MKKKLINPRDGLIVLAILLLAGALWGWHYWTNRNAEPSGLYAEIYVDNTLVRTVYLSEDTEFALDELPAVRLAVKDHAIAFVHSDCPDQVCVHMGWQDMPGGFAACLPNQVLLWVESDEPVTDIVAK